MNDLTVESLLPVDGGVTSCGNRRDLPKKERRHLYTVLGTDVRNCGDRGFCEGLVMACMVCGRDKFSRTKQQTDLWTEF